MKRSSRSVAIFVAAPATARSLTQWPAPRKVQKEVKHDNQSDRSVAAALGRAGQGYGRDPLSGRSGAAGHAPFASRLRPAPARAHQDRKSTRLNSSHVRISYAVFCLKKKKNTQ